MPKKLTLEELQVKSFVTEADRQLRAGCAWTGVVECTCYYVTDGYPNCDTFANCPYTIDCPSGDPRVCPVTE